MMDVSRMEIKVNLGRVTFTFFIVCSEKEGEINSSLETFKAVSEANCSDSN